MTSGLFLSTGRCGIFVETNLLRISELRRSGIVRICRFYGAGGLDGMVDYKYGAPPVRGATAMLAQFRAASGKCGAFTAAFVRAVAFIYLLTIRAGESARGLAHSKTLRAFGRFREYSRVMDCDGRAHLRITGKRSGDMDCDHRWLIWWDSQRCFWTKTFCNH